MIFQMTAPAITDIFGEREFSLFRAYIFDKTGIDFGPEKKHRLVNRLQKRMAANNVARYREYYDIVRDARDTDPEVVNLFDELTVNETSFFRNPGHFDALADAVLPALRAARPARRRPLAVWSAACSTGEEPYSLAMHLAQQEAQGKCPFSFRVTATDICSRVLGTARGGVYDADRVENVPAALKRRYLRATDDGRYRVADVLREKIAFKRFNLKNAFPFPGFDVVFIRNVLMYFNDEQQRDVVRRITALLPPGGYLFLGDAEVLRWEARAYERARSGAAMYYRKI